MLKYTLKKRNLITGGAGFVGRALVKELLGQDEEVLVADNLFTGTKNNISEFMDDPNFEFLRHDINNPLYVEVDRVFNLASPASPIQYQVNPVQTIKTNVIGTTNMLGLAKRLTIPLIQASTSEIYGDPEQHPQTETYWGNVNTVGPRSCYDEGKRCAETLCSDYSSQYHLDIRIARIFNTYGPYMHQNDGRVVSNFIIQALMNDEITIYGDGSQTRSFCYVDDLVKGLVDFGSFDKNQNDELLTIMNLGNPKEFTILQLANTVKEMTGSRSKISFKSIPQDDPKQRQPNIEMAEKLIEWSPSVVLSEGLSKTIKYFETSLEKRALAV